MNRKVMKSPDAQAAAEAANLIDSIEAPAATAPETPSSP
jgi:hypothetical protein